MYVAFDELGQQKDICEDLGYTNLFPEYDWRKTDLAIDLSAQRFALEDGEIKVIEFVDAPPASYLIYDFIHDYQGDRTASPRHIIFPEQLDIYPPKRSYIAKGERTKTIYFSDDTYSTSIIKVEYVFNRDEKGLLLSKTRTISWKLDNGHWAAETKPYTIPVSSETERLQEIKIRRENIIDGLKGLAAEMGITDYILELFKAYQLECDLYKNSGSALLYKAIKEETNIPWLDARLPNGKVARAALLLHLEVGVTEPFD